MTLYDKRKKKISEELKDKEYRDIFVEEKINIGIPFQIRALRGELTQKEFGNLFGLIQEEISRYENINYSKFTLSTLKKLARAFDVGLMVRFVSFGELVEHDLNLSADSLKALSFDKDSYFQEEKITELATINQDETSPPIEAEVTEKKSRPYVAKPTNPSAPRDLDMALRA